MENPLKPEHFNRVDNTPDRAFYGPPRIVKHIDEQACEALAKFYKDNLPAGGAVLDLMSSCVSHLPEDGDYERVIGLGMNAMELRANKQLTGGLIKDLNDHPVIPFADESFDACLIAVSVQYLTKPVEVFAEIARVLRPGAPLIVSFSNRCFPTKAVAVWRSLDDENHANLIDLYCNLAGGFGPRDAVNLSPFPGRSDPLYAVVGRKI